MLSVLTNTHMLMAARDAGVERFFYSSSACVYNGEKQTNRGCGAAEGSGRVSGAAGGRLRLGEAVQRAHVPALRRGLRAAVAAWPATTTCMGRIGTWNGGREKAPAAICRKVIEAKTLGQARDRDLGRRATRRAASCTSTTACKGTQMIMESEIDEPINLGSSELVTINQLVDIVEDIAGVKLKRNYNLSAPKGVNGRNSDNTHDPGAAGMGAFDRGCARAWRRPTAGSRVRSNAGHRASNGMRGAAGVSDDPGRAVLCRERVDRGGRAHGARRAAGGAGGACAEGHATATRRIARRLLDADLCIADSAFMVLIWNVSRSRRFDARLSGLEYLRELLRGEDAQRAGQYRVDHGQARRARSGISSG